MGINKRISIHIAIKERASEPALLIQSLRTQTYQDWDLVILDGNKIPLATNHFFISLINRVKLERHGVNIIKDDLNKGVCYARNKIIKEDYFNNPFVCRLDDDTIIQPDYLDKLMVVIKSGYDIASGVTPLLGYPELIRSTKKVKPIINKKEFNTKGEITKYGDDCGYAYLEKEIISTHEFRSCALIKKEVIEKIQYEENLSPTGFREEAFFSFRAIYAGFKIGVHTGAIAYHIACPSGGVRSTDYGIRAQSDDNYFKKWVKKLYKKNGPIKIRG